MDSQSIKEEDQKPVSNWKWFKWLFTLFLVILLLFILCIFLLRFPKVQNWAVDKLTHKYSKKLDTRVEIGRVNLDIKKGLVLEDFYLEGLENDTLIFGKELSTGFAKSLYSVFKNELDLSYVSLEDAQVNLVKRKGQEKNNLVYLLNKLGSKSNSGKEGKPFNFNLSKLAIDNIKFTSIDENSNQNISVTVQNGVLEIDNIADLNKPIEFSKIFFFKPQIEYITGNSSEQLSLDSNDTLDVEKPKTFPGLIIGEFQIQEATVTHKNLDKLSIEKTDYFDYQNLNLNNINLLVKDFDARTTHDLDFVLKRISFSDKNKFTVDNISSSAVSISNKKIELKDFLLETPDSEISDYLSLSYNDFSDFNNFTNRVRLDFDMNKTDITLSDLNYFIPGLTKNDFFRLNKHRNLRINGKINNRVNNLSGRDVRIVVDGETTFAGSFSTRNLTSGNEALLNIKVDELSTNVVALKEIVPKFKPPQNFYKLGNLNFAGRFDGYIENFVAYGTLRTNLGRAEMDINLDVQDGSENAEYSGELALINFDLAKWTDNADFGLVNFESFIEDGRGLTRETAFANMDAKVQSFVFKGYTYRDFTMDGTLDKNQFVGLFRIKDPNADFLFDGEILLEDGIPKFDFVADIDNLDLQALKLSDKKSVLKGKVNLNASGNSLYAVDGQTLLQGLSYTDSKGTYYVESVFVESYLEGSKRHVDLTSDLGTASIEGKMDFRLMAEGIKMILKDSYPHHFRKVKVDRAKAATLQDFKFDLDIVTTKNFLTLAGLEGYELDNLQLDGAINTAAKSIELEGHLDKFIMKTDTIYNIDLAGLNRNKEGELSLVSDSLSIGGRAYNSAGLTSTFKSDQIEFNLKTVEIFDSLQAIDLSGVITSLEGYYDIELDDSNLEMLGSKWKFSENNHIQIGENYVDINGLVLTDENNERSIHLNDLNNKGLKLSLEKFNFLTINGLIDYDKIDFAGEGDVHLEVDNIFNMQNLEASVKIPELTLNDEVYGEVNVQALKQKTGDYQIDVGIIGDKMSLALKAFIDEETKEMNGKLVTQDVPFSLFQMIIPSGISEVEGGMNADINLFGSLDDPQFEGSLRVMNGAVKIDYVGEKYFTHNQPIKVTHYLIDFQNGILTDHEGNEAKIVGTMTHEFLADFNMDVEIVGEDIIIVNTTEKDNPFYFGKGKGDATVKFTGPFSNADMVINATTGPETVMNIPVKYYETGYEESFITFTNKEDLIERGNNISLDSFKVEGLDVEMNVSITPDAELNIIFDKQLNDVLRGRGTGDVQIYITREGEFLTYGDFVIESGSYNLTIYNFANKAFNIRQGGTIRWTGDPVNTNLDISAQYEDLKTNLDVFLAEFLDPNLSSATAQAEAGRKKEVDLLMHIGGTLYEPIVNFDLEFPDIESAELKSYVDSKMRSLRTNPNSLNDQVAGLITFNTFLPSTNSQRLDIYNGATALNTATSTLSEMVSNQFSYLITNFLNEAIGDNSIFSSIDVELGLNQNNILNSEDAGLFDLFDPDEIESYLNARFKFLDEKFSVRVGGNYIRRGNFLNQLENGALIGDVAIEYDITDDRRLKLRFYNRFDRDEVSGNPKNKSGLGLSYRKEFGSLVDFKRDIYTQTQELKKESGIE